MKKTIDKILKEFDKHNEMQEWCSGKDAEEIKQFLTQAITQAVNQALDEVEMEKEKIEINKPHLTQFENRGSAPYYCSLCFMDELKMSENKTKDGRYFCYCSYWSDPHNSYVDKSGGKWLGWKISKVKVKKLIEETYPSAWNECVNQLNQNIKKLKEAK
jgi:hypothetical protein